MLGQIICISYLPSLSVSLLRCEIGKQILIPASPSDVIFTGLCFYKAIQIAKVGQVTEILKLFLRDGSMYFVIVSLANVVQTGFFIQPHTGMKVINAFAALGLSSMMCCRCVYKKASKARRGIRCLAALTCNADLFFLSNRSMLPIILQSALSWTTIRNSANGLPIPQMLNTRCLQRPRRTWLPILLN